GQRLVGLEVGSDTKGDVISLFDKVDAAVRQMELHPDQRIAAQEGRHRAWSKDVGKLRRATHAQVSANFIAGAGDDRLRGLKSAGDDLALGEDIAADLGHLDAAGRALDEADAQIPLELSHPSSELRLGLAGRARRGGEAAVAHHLREIMQIVQVLQLPLPPYLSFLQKKQCVVLVRSEE